MIPSIELRGKPASSVALSAEREQDKTADNRAKKIKIPITGLYIIAPSFWYVISIEPQE
jgi:hypothetical protein